MRVNESELNSSVLPRDPPTEGAPRRQPWVTSALAAILIFTIAVDLLGNLLVILSVYRNKKLRNAALLKSQVDSQRKVDIKFSSSFCEITLPLCKRTPPPGVCLISGNNFPKSEILVLLKSIANLLPRYSNEVNEIFSNNIMRQFQYVSF
ncbi:hypothetical protein DUI87_09125 [Hirundo rustica rustica]|uniref:G-protein coupled receptors family 1 profile domain-containing protein n=1 Tax=Hirundo rustica rustica TaxID=333673 RepID=A0A3M0KLB1_HIRRU|nr:hypothetical protein DUI87_09125 [Hirundo rustica rustica]